MRRFWFLLHSIGMIAMISCRHEPVAKPDLKKGNHAPVLIDSARLIRTTLADSLVSMMHDQVAFDSLIVAITHPERVRVVARLKEHWNDSLSCYEYSDSVHSFFIKQKVECNNVRCLRGTFVDGKHSFRFENFSPLCLKHPGYRCESEGFDIDNILVDPVVVEVAGKQFLYSDMSFFCIGDDCNHVMTFIYDMTTHRPVFLQTLGVRTKYLLSDFDNNGSPDLLLIAQTPARKLRGFDAEEFEVRLTMYDWNSGRPRPKINTQTANAYSIDLYTIMDSAAARFHNGRRYSLLKNSWIPEH